MRVFLILPLCLLIIFYNTAFSQKFKISNIYPELFPTMQLDFWAVNEYWEAYEDIEKSELNLEIDGRKIENFEMDCNIEFFSPPVSVILLFDVSHSMSTTCPGGEQRVDWAKFAAKTFVDSLNMEFSSAIKIMTFTHGIEYVGDFLSNKNKIYEEIDSINVIESTTNFNAPFLDPRQGAIKSMKHGIPDSRRIIVFLTDGFPCEEIRTDAIINLANSWLTEIYAINLFTDYSEELNRIATETKGKYFQASGKSELADIYSDIARNIMSGDLCRLTWHEPYICSKDDPFRNATLSFSRSGLNDERKFHISESEYAKIYAREKEVLFGGDNAVGKKITIPFIAKNTDFIINNIGIEPENESFELPDIPNLPYMLNMNDTLYISVAMKNPPNDKKQYKVTFDTEPCPFEGIDIISGCEVKALEKFEFEGAVVGYSRTITIPEVVTNTFSHKVWGAIGIDGNNPESFKLCSNQYFSLDPGEKLNIDIAFCPGKEGLNTARVRYLLRDACDEGMTLLSGKGLGYFKNDMIDFEEISFCAASDTTIYIPNKSQHDDEMFGYTILGDDRNNFLVEFPEQIIKSGKTTPVNITFLPQDSLRELNSTIFIQKNSGNIYIDVKGKATLINQKNSIVGIRSNSALYTSGIVQTVPGHDYSLILQSEIPETKGEKFSQLKFIFNYHPGFLFFAGNVKSGNSDWAWTINDRGQGIMTLDGIGPRTDTPENIALEIPFRTYLSDSNFCLLKLSAVFPEELKCLNPLPDSINIENNICFGDGYKVIFSDFIDLNLFPEPAIEKLNINYTGNSDELITISIVSANGQKIKDITFEKSEKNNPIVLDISEFPNGIYFLRANTERGTINKKFSVFK